MAKAYKNLTGPGPCARISSIERGLQKKSNYQPKQLERSIKGKDIVVLKEEHNRRKKRVQWLEGSRWLARKSQQNRIKARLDCNEKQK